MWITLLFFQLITLCVAHGPYISPGISREIGSGALTHDHKGQFHTSSIHTNVGFNGISGQLMVGYGMPFKDIYVAIEAGGSYCDILGKFSAFERFRGFNNESHKTLFRKKESFIAAIKIGKEINPLFLVYLKGGLALTKYHVSILHKSYFDIHSIEHHKRLWQRLVGVGTEYTLTPLYSLGLEYEHYFRETTVISSPHDNVVISPFNEKITLFLKIKL